MCFLPLKSSHYPSRPVPVPELFGKYLTRPVPKSKTPTRLTLLMPCLLSWDLVQTQLCLLVSQPTQTFNVSDWLLHIATYKQ